MSSHHRDDGPAGLTQPELGQVTPLTADQQRALTNRRRFLQITVGGSLAAIGAAFAFPVLAIRSISQFADVVAEGDLIGDPGSNTPLDVAAFPVNTGTYAGILGKSTQSTLNQLEVVRIAETGEAEDFRVYNVVCTHLGCPVSETLNEQGNVWCGCHGSVFSSEEGAVLAGPAARPLPQLPVAFDDEGRLIVAGEYSSDV